MRVRLPWAVWLIILITLQAFFGTSLEINHIKPDFFLLFVLYIAMTRGGTQALFLRTFPGPRPGCPVGGDHRLQHSHKTRDRVRGRHVSVET